MKSIRHKSILRKSILQQYRRMLERLFDHVGVPAPVTPIRLSDCTNRYWLLTADSMRLASNITALDEFGGDCTEFAMMSKSDIYLGEEISLFRGGLWDGIRWYIMLDTKKRVKER